MQEIEFIIEEDIFSKDFIIKNFSKKFYGYLKSTKSLFFVNNKEVDLNCQLKVNDVYLIKYFNKVKNSILVNKDITILYEDDYIIALDKEHNLQTIPSKKENNDSLYNRVIFHRPNDSINIITRLDEPTAGVVIISKKSYLTKIITDGITKKLYIAKTVNLLDTIEGSIELNIKKSDTIKRVISNNGVFAKTLYKLIDKDNKIYELELITGRTHQIRVHLSYYNCSIVGDSLYGDSSGDLNLVCREVQLVHPITKELIIIKSNFDLR